MINPANSLCSLFTILDVLLTPQILRNPFNPSIPQILITQTVLSKYPLIHWSCISMLLRVQISGHGFRVGKDIGYVSRVWRKIPSKILKIFANCAKKEVVFYIFTFMYIYSSKIREWFHKEGMNITKTRVRISGDIEETGDLGSRSEMEYI